MSDPILVNNAELKPTVAPIISQVVIPITIVLVVPVIPTVGAIQVQLAPALCA